MIHIRDVYIGERNSRDRIQINRRVTAGVAGRIAGAAVGLIGVGERHIAQADVAGAADFDAAIGILNRTARTIGGASSGNGKAARANRIQRNADAAADVGRNALERDAAASRVDHVDGLASSAGDAVARATHPQRAAAGDVHARAAGCRDTQAAAGEFNRRSGVGDHGDGWIRAGIKGFAGVAQRDCATGIILNENARTSVIDRAAKPDCARGVAFNHNRTPSSIGDRARIRDRNRAGADREICAADAADCASRRRQRPINAGQRHTKSAAA